MAKLRDLGRRRILASFFRKWNTPYSLHLTDDTSSEELINMKLTKKNVYLIASTICIASFILFSLLFMLTPLRYYIPGYETNSSRKKLLKLNREVDSLVSLNRSRDVYIGNLLGVTSDDAAFLGDTTLLNMTELERAEWDNLSEIDKAGRYAHLRRKRKIKKDTSNKTVKSRKSEVKEGAESKKDKAEIEDNKSDSKSISAPPKKKQRDTFIIYK